MVAHVGEVNVTCDDVAIVHPGFVQNVAHSVHSAFDLGFDFAYLVARSGIQIRLTCDVERIPHQNTGTVRFARWKLVWVQKSAWNLVARCRRR